MIVSTENVVGLTTKHLADNMNQQGMNISISSVYENYLRPLIKHGVINCVQSILNGKEKIYYPVNHGNEDDLSTSTLHLTEDCRLIANKPFDEKKVLKHC